MSNLENEREMWGDIVRADREDRGISGRMIRKVGPHPGGDFGQGPELEKNESGRGYHVKGAPGFEGGGMAEGGGDMSYSFQQHYHRGGGFVSRDDN